MIFEFPFTFLNDSTYISIFVNPDGALNIIEFCNRAHGRHPKGEKLPEQKFIEDRDSVISFGEHSAEESDDDQFENHTTRATFFNGQDNKSINDFGVAASANLSKRLLQKMEFGQMMKR